MCPLPLLLAAVVLLQACSQGREKEPNDHFTQATPVSGKKKMSGTLERPDDADIYKLSGSAQPKTLSVRLRGIREADFVLSYLDGDRRELKRVDESALGGDELLLDLGLDSKASYLVVGNKNPQMNNPGQEYSLELSYDKAEGRESEPNDSALKADELPIGGTFRGRYFPARNLLAEETGFEEEDWLRLSVPQEGQFLLNLDVSEVPNIDAILEIYGPNAYKLKEIDAGGPGQAEVLRGFGLRGPVHYFLRLRAKSRNQWNGEIPYEILTELLPYRGGAEFEPNDQRLEATVIDGAKFEGRIGSAGDADWYKIAVPEGGKRILSARLGAAPGLDLKLELTDEIGRVLTVVDDAGAEQPESLTGFGVGYGDYYLVATETTGKKFDARSVYELETALAVHQPGLEFESNDSTMTAQALEAGSSVDGYLAPKGDADYYEFNLYRKSQVRAEASGIVNARLGLALVAADGTEFARAAAAKPGESPELARELEAGAYFLRVAPLAAAEHNTRDKYTLRLRAE